MATSIHYIGLTCIILLAMQPLVAGLQCYVCAACTTPTGLQTVASGASGYSCTKTTTMLAGSVTSVSRGYSLTSGCPETNTVVGGTGVTSTCCTTDGCNGSIAISSSVMLTLVVAAICSLMKITMMN